MPPASDISRSLRYRRDARTALTKLRTKLLCRSVCGERLRGDGVAPAPLPADWTQGMTPEGYEYYWHHPTGTSAWERPTAATQLVMVVPLSAEAVAALRGAGPSGVAKVQEASGCVVTLKAGQAAVSGTAEGIEHAATLLRRKADGLLYAARAMTSARPAAAAAPSGSHGQQRKAEWEFLPRCGGGARRRGGRGASRWRGAGNARRLWGQRRR
mgnify:CR=1 FL=1